LQLASFLRCARSAFDAAGGVVNAGVAQNTGRTGAGVTGVTGVSGVACVTSVSGAGVGVCDERAHPRELDGRQRAFASVLVLHCLGP
jgi:hypothetical protein